MATTARIGLAGLGTMGSALALNIAEKGFPVAVWNRNTAHITEVMEEAGPLRDALVPSETLEELVAAIAPPRAIIIMVKAGAPVFETIEKLVPLLDKGDTLIDAGNADFNDTRATEKRLREKGIHFIGMGVSGGEDGARHGPSIMVGGDASAYEPIRDIVEAIAATYEGDPCAARLGPDGAGHFVKTVHNGIEYADMELIAEASGLMRKGQGKSPAEIAKVFGRWNEGRLQSYLCEITEKVLSATDPETGKPAVDLIVDEAGQKGTGRWTLIEALKLGQSASTIEAAVAARSWSAMSGLRAEGAKAFGEADGPAPALSEDDLGRALLAARILAYGQGFLLLKAASDEFGWDIDLARVAEIWRAGCIIRSSLLDDIAAAIRDGLPEGALHLAPAFREPLVNGAPALRQVVTQSVTAGLPATGFASALSYFDSMRQGRGTADLIQGLRDFFGRHGFERVGAEGVHHGPWWD
ncbi:NADP-dependent phosphogluconate dehydrogenase [Tropicimonas sp. IMCC34011]|uniref:NADP-dependent phosphogluconate dehydrogenase n=1 Tax=Tropicimonas sp. IMCC34011 TaxID=2248759 RepID=UPI000E247F8F|nr:NADP-dependent phosphogluconate dehydrogenase [Tropicimonas sp. IMCC34011]